METLSVSHSARPQGERSGLQDAGLADPAQTPQGLDVASMHQRVGEAIEREPAERITGHLGHRHVRAPGARVQDDLHSCGAERTRPRTQNQPTDGSTASTSVWSLTVIGPAPTR